MSTEERKAMLLEGTLNELKSHVHGFCLSDEEIEKLTIQALKSFRLEPSDMALSSQVLLLARAQRDAQKREAQREEFELEQAKPRVPAVVQPWAIKEIELSWGDLYSSDDILELEVEARKLIHVPHPSDQTLSNKIVALAREYAPKRKQDKELAQREADARAAAVERLRKRGVEFRPFANELHGATELAQRLASAWAMAVQAETRLVIREQYKAETLQKLAVSQTNNANMEFDGAHRDEIVAQARSAEAVRNYQEVAEQIHSTETLEKLKNYAQRSAALEHELFISQLAPLIEETRQALTALITASEKSNELGRSMINGIFHFKQAADALNLRASIDVNLYTPDAIKRRIQSELSPLLRQADLSSFVPTNGDLFMRYGIKAQG